MSVVLQMIRFQGPGVRVHQPEMGDTFPSINGHLQGTAGTGGGGRVVSKRPFAINSFPRAAWEREKWRPSAMTTYFVTRHPAVETGEGRTSIRLQDGGGQGVCNWPR